MAMVLFLAVIGVVFTFVPGMLDPFTDETDRPLVANRVADQLVGYHLSAETGPADLNLTCTRWFFNGSGPDTCPGFNTSESLTERVGVSSTTHLNVTLAADLDGDRTLEVLCGSAAGIGPCTAGGTPMAVGDRPPSEYGAQVTARRGVFVDGRSVSLIVRVW